MNSKIDGFEREMNFSQVEYDKQTIDNSLLHPLLHITAPKESVSTKINRYLFPKVDTCDRKITNNKVVYPSNYMSNRVNNCKYSLLTIIPMFLFNQYKVFSNFYFLFIALTQLYEPFKIGFAVTYFGPLAMVTLLSFLKEVWDEYKRKVKDNELNAEKYILLHQGKDSKIRSDQIKVGDILRLEKNQRVPADLILLQTSDPSGTVFVRTDQLDGETDWKVREAVKFTQKLEKSHIFSTHWTAIAEAPSEFIYDFKGSFYTDEGFEPLRLANSVWANMRVANADIIGLVIFTGKETRMALNTKDSNTKSGKTDEEINVLSKFMFLILGILTIMIYILSGPFFRSDFMIHLLRIFLLLSSIIPISLKVNVDFAKLYYSFTINDDSDLKGTIARNSSIPEELGRIQYLLSDKTGTLTRNEMIFKHLRSPAGEFSEESFNKLRVVAEKVFSSESSQSNDGSSSIDARRSSKTESSKNSITLKQTLLSLMLCNNVSPIYDDDERKLQASSPDEVALVNFAETLGFLMESRTPDKVVLKLPNHSTETWSILENFPFTSESKRMGIIIRNDATNQILFLLKGADSIMVDRIDTVGRMYVEEEAEKLSKEGLRTLVFTAKKLSPEDYAAFKQRMAFAAQNLKTRDREEKKCVENIEGGMNLLAVTGVEDLLQEDIKSSILTLRNAGIKVWMLTGDKLETAKCIAISTGFKSNEQKFYELNSTRASEIAQQLTDFRSEDTLLVSGPVLEVIFSSSSLTEQFFFRARDCVSVVLCRCAPKQKAEVTMALKSQLGKVVCGIGDGGNDVGMIQCANVGIGIEGKEGLQAALASDFSVRKFNQIVRLILWHGRLSYVRTSLMTNFVLHRGLVISVIQVLFMTLFYYATIYIFNGYLTLCYSTVFTCLPVFALILDQDIPMKQAFNYPELYQLVQEGQHISIEEFLSWLWKSIFQGSVIIMLSLYFLENTLTEFVTITFTALIFLEYLNILTSIRTWHRYMVYSICLSIVIYLFCLLFLQEMFYFSSLSLETTTKIFVITYAAWFPFQVVQTIRRTWFPTPLDKIINEAKMIESRIEVNKNRFSLD